MPTKTKLKSNELYVCIESFASDEYAVARGTRFRGDNPIVDRYSHSFAPADTADDELHRLRAELNAPPPPPEPLGRVKLRVLPGHGGDRLMIHGGKQQVVMA